MRNPTLEANAIEYAALCEISLNLKTPLGYGNDGCIWKSSRQSAVKAFERMDNYRRESECYGIYYYDAKPGNIHFGDEDV